MNYSTAFVISQGYKYERTKSSTRAKTYRDWLAQATAKDPANRLEIVRLFEIGRSEART
jgi:hypothetical protein